MQKIIDMWFESEEIAVQFSQSKMYDVGARVLTLSAVKIQEIVNAAAQNSSRLFELPRLHKLVYNAQWRRKYHLTTFFHLNFHPIDPNHLPS